MGPELVRVSLTCLLVVHSACLGGGGRGGGEGGAGRGAGKGACREPEQKVDHTVHGNDLSSNDSSISFT